MRLVLIIFLSSIFFSCSEKHLGYNKNKLLFQELVSDINTYFNNADNQNLAISDYYHDDFVFYSYAAGNKKGQETDKKTYIENFKNMKLAGLQLSIGHSIYLPGVNQETFDFDGSVRVYYGATLSLDSIQVDFSGYQTIDFKNGKILGIWEWADYGGVSNQLTQSIE